MFFVFFFFFFFKQKTAYEMQRGLVGSEMCIRDRYQRRVHGDVFKVIGKFDEDMNEEFRIPIYKMTHDSYMDIAKCYESPTISSKEADICTQKASQRMSIYEQKIQMIWKNTIEKMTPCLQKCQEAEKPCISKCINDTLSEMYPQFKNLHSGQIQS
eukprot:TRINITY_DN3497_c0_g1_i9.p1 TRINITY_DN3497_c0_g1~~TRINITY_DN3497_c0_g1_i9.p1  ORF type:complete len:156 (+),score=52.65 TRINITY_DN3497_c0_g1_i9:114-581(+)